VIINDSSTPQWLQFKLKKNKSVLEAPTLDLTSFLSKIDRPNEKKKVKIQSRISQDATRSRIIEMATPMVDKDNQDLRIEDFHITIVNLGPTSRM